MLQRCRRLSSAFTIVELLIVIVVIGILAAIVITSYLGVQQRAYNAQIIQGTKEYYNAIEIYRSLNSIYPTVSGESTSNPAVAMTCLGRGYPNAQCGMVTGATISEDPAFYTEIATVLGNTTPPIIGKNVITVSEETYTGAVYGIDTVDPSKHPGSPTYGRVIEYALMGKNTDCEISGSYSYNVASNPPTTACEIYLEAYP